MGAVFALTLDIRNSPFAPGTVIGVFPIDWVFQSGDMIDFLLVKIKTSKYSIAEMQVDFPLKKAVKLSEASDKIELHKAQAENWNNNRVLVLPMKSISVKPDFDRVVDIDKEGVLVDTPKNQWEILNAVQDPMELAASRGRLEPQ